MDKKKPSVLLRIGSKQVKHVRRKLFQTDDDGNIRGACAIGMIIIAATGTMTHYEATEGMATVCGWLNALHCPSNDDSLCSTVMDWNDEQRLSVNQIVAKLEAMGL